MIKNIIKTLLISMIGISMLAAAEEINDKTTITDINSKTYTAIGTQKGIDIEGFEGKVIMIDVFGHSCPPCLRSIPHLIDIQNKYKDKLSIIAIEVQDYDKEELEEFVKEKEINYITATQEGSYDFLNYIQQRAQWDGGIPFLILIDTKGEVQLINVGMIPQGALEEMIEVLIKEGGED